MRKRIILEPGLYLCGIDYTLFIGVQTGTWDVQRREDKSILIGYQDGTKISNIRK
jgi:hypothetical protein